MADVFRLPKLKTLDRIVDALGRPSISFVKFFNTDFAGSIERQEAKQQQTDERQDAVDQELIEINDVQDMLIGDLAEAQAGLVEAIATINAVLGIVNASSAAIQAAAEAANNAQATADEALAGGTVSDFATDPAIDVPEGGGWIAGPQVDLTGVVAGNLTLSGTGPLQDGDVAITNPEVLPGGVTFSGDYRVMEIVLGVETEVFAGAVSAFQTFGSTNASISNDSASAVAAFSLARASTGAVSYRLDFFAQRGSATSLKGYLFARRAA